LLLLFIGFASQAQLIIIQQVNPIETKYSDGWSATVQNMESHLAAIAELKISKHGKLIVHALSKQFNLPKGETQLSFNSLKIDRLTVQPEGAFSWNKYLNQGDYEICLKVRSIENTPEAESCLPHEILPLSPPMLISPSSGSEIEDLLPMLTWSPPIPLNIYEHLQYDLTLVEMMPMQSSYEALARNRPFVQLKNYTDLVYQYSPTNATLIPGKEYAWQVSAYDGGKLIGKTEVWKFKVKKETPKVREELLPDYYYELSAPGAIKSSGGAKGCLGFTCAEEMLDTNMKYTITDAKGKKIDTKEARLVLSKQANYFILYMNDCKAIKKGRSYRLDIVANSSKKYFIDFIYQDPDLKK
jgi:hypothetical protein